MSLTSWLERPAVRQAIQTAIGVGAAVAAGSALSGKRWYWAVIAAFIVVIGVGSRGEAAVKGLQRIAGTILGVAAGIALATAVSGHTLLALELSLICVFFAYYAFQVAYGTMIFFITLMLALLYGLLGEFRPELLVLRLEETALGAVIGTAAVFLILPKRQNEAFTGALVAYLDALSRVLSPDPQADRAQAISELREKTQGLRNAHGASKRGWGGFMPPAYRDTIRAAMRCTYLAREWMTTDRPWDPDTETKPLAERAARRVAAITDAPSARSGPDPGRDPAAEPHSVAAEFLQALDDSIARLATAAASLRRRA